MGSLLLFAHLGNNVQIGLIVAIDSSTYSIENVVQLDSGTNDLSEYKNSI